MQYYVRQDAPAGGDGSAQRPFQTIQAAADLAQPGDAVLVGPGVYREAVDPKHGGRPDARIVYRALEPGKSVITGAQIVTNWQPYQGDVYLARIPNAQLGPVNPYTERVWGDWYLPKSSAHTGEVFLGAQALYEVDSLDKVLSPSVSRLSWQPEQSLRTWYTCQDEARGETLLYANFGGADPNRETVEITVRRSCFAPSRQGIGYLTLRGFVITRAATQWAPPTAFQAGMVAPNWSRGWVIECCEISHAKCVGISLGKYLQAENDNKWSKIRWKEGAQTERECVCQALRDGWSKQTVGSHTIRRCHIHDCGQAGIVGHLGAAFSRIEENHIHHINCRQNLLGAEVAGVKLHAAIDVVFQKNHVHHCTRGLWLDWQAQGTRVTGNLFHNNTLPIPDAQIEPEDPGFGEDVFVEVSHGPTMIDHNILLSDCALKLPTQGVAVAHNLIAGGFCSVGLGVENGTRTLPSPRYTPYHVPHETVLAGFMTILHGDMRFYNNVFVQMPLRAGPKRVMDYLQGPGKNRWDDGNLLVGTWVYDGYPTQAQWRAQFAGYCGMGSGPTDRYYTPLPVWAAGNVYLGGARPWQKETPAWQSEAPVQLQLQEQDGVLTLRTDLCAQLPSALCTAMVGTETLPMALEPEQRFENPDGSSFWLDADYCGARRGKHPLPGPFETRADCYLVDPAAAAGPA